MNDDLEQELSALRPAAPPPALLRRLRTLPSPARSPWWQRLSAVCIGESTAWQVATVGVSAVVLAGWLLRSVVLPAIFPNPPFSTERLGASSVHHPALPVSTVAWNRPSLPNETFETIKAERGDDPSSKALRSTSLDSVAARVDSGNDYTALGQALLSSTTDAFDLETPTGPIRLNCGGFRFVNDGSEQAFEHLSLSFRSRF